MDETLYLSIKRNGLHALGIHLMHLPKPLGIVDLPAIINHGRSEWSSIPKDATIHLTDEDATRLRKFVFDAKVDDIECIIDAHDGARWLFETERSGWI